MKPDEIDDIFRSCTEKRQNEIIARLSESLPDDIRETILAHFALVQWFNNPDKYNAIKKAMGETIYNELKHN